MPDGFESIQHQLQEAEASSMWHRIFAQPERIPILDLPLFLRLGKNAVDTLAIVNPRIDLHLEGLQFNGVDIDEIVPALLVNPRTINFSEQRGYHALRPGEELVLGHLPGISTHLEELDTQVSGNRTMISLNHAGNLITVADLHSEDGTFIGTPGFDTRMPAFQKSASTTHSGPDALMPELPKPIDAYTSTTPNYLRSHRNEDSSFSHHQLGVFGVFDGVGGSENGAEASYTTARWILANVADLPNTASRTIMDQRMRMLILAANKTLLDRADGNGMRTTATIAKVYTTPSGERTVSIASVGDSRAYLLRRGELTMLTTDHNLFRQHNGKQEARKQQEVLAMTDNIGTLTSEQLDAFNDRHILSSCLGNSTIDIDVEHYLLQPWDIILLTTDGVHDNLTTHEMQTTLNSTNTIDAAQWLTRAAQKRSRELEHDRHKSDDTTAIVIGV